MKIHPVAVVFLLAMLPWHVVSADEIHHSKVAQIISYKTQGLEQMMGLVSLVFAIIAACFLFFLCCSFVSKKLAKRRERQAEEPRS